MEAESDLKKFLLCSSMLEEKVAATYEHLAGLIGDKIIKCLLEFIACDSLKHARFFEMMAKALHQEASVHPEDCARVWGKSWLTVIESAEEVLKKHEFNLADLSSILDSLHTIESFAAEEYLVTLYVKLFEAMVSEKTKLESFRVMLKWVIEDEERHRKTLEMIKEVLFGHK